MHHRRSRKQVVHVVHTKYEVNPSIIRDCKAIQTSAVENLVFDPLTAALFFFRRNLKSGVADCSFDIFAEEVVLLF